MFLGASAEGQLAAVKVVHANLAADPEYRARFAGEVEVASTVSGPFTAPVIDADLDGPVPWLATAYIAGSSLEEAPRRRDQPSRRRNWRSLSAAAVIAGMLGAAIGLVLTATPNPPPPAQPPRQVAAKSAPAASTAAPTNRPHPSASKSPNPHLTSGGYGY